MADVKHAFVSGIGDGGDATLVRPSNWNAAHVVTATTVEKNLGTPTLRGSFTITDAAIGTGSKVLVWQAPGPYTGKGTLADEAAMQPVNVSAVEPLAGSCKVYWETPPMLTPIVFVGGSGGAGGDTTTFTGRQDDSGGEYYGVRRLGKVNGNVKFTYMLFS